MSEARDSTLPRIMIVDDDEISAALLATTLAPDFHVTCVTNGEECLARVDEFAPRVILLDIEMPGIDGYETCRRLKANAEYADIWVIFVSARANVEERIAGYDAGGNDYIVKPFEPLEIQHKLRAAIRAGNELEAHKSRADMASQTAMTAMTSSGELGVVLQFLSDSYQCRHYDELAAAILAAVANYGLQAVVQVRNPHAIITRNSRNIYNGLEEELMLSLRDKDRILEFGGKLAFNFAAASLLILNPPWDDPERVGRYRDSLATLMEGAVSRISAIDHEYLLQAQQDMLAQVISKTRKALHSIGAQHSENKQANMAILNDLLIQVENSFMTLGLNEDQEEHLLHLVQRAVNQSMALYEQDLQAENELGELVRELESFT